MRSLANRTQLSSSEISEMIASLQAGAGRAVEVMQSSKQLAQQTVEQTLQAENALAKIRQEVGSINEMNAQIATASEEQGAVAEEVNQSVTRIHDSTVASSAASNQVASSSPGPDPARRGAESQGQLLPRLTTRWLNRKAPTTRPGLFTFRRSGMPVR